MTLAILVLTIGDIFGLCIAGLLFGGFVIGFIVMFIHEAFRKIRRRGK